MKLTNQNIFTMKNLLLLIVSLFFFNCTYANKPIEDEEKLVEISEGVLQHLVAKEFSQIPEDFNARMKDALTPDMLKEVWNGLVAQIGEYQEKGNVITDVIKGYRVVYIICKFETQPFKLKVVFDDQDLVAGLFIIPVNQK